MSAIWINSKMNPIETGNKLFNAYRSRELGVRAQAYW